MHLGLQLFAPDGLGELARNCVYHFLRSCPTRMQVQLVTFGARVEDESGGPSTASSQTLRSRLICLPRDVFERAVLQEKIMPCPSQRVLPHWFGEDLTLEALMAHDESDCDRKRPHAQRIDRAVSHIWPAVQRMDEVLKADSPTKVLNAFARACDPPQNETRYRTSFYAYVAFGMNRWALHYVHTNLGKWDRMGRETKFGRPSIADGPGHGFSSCDEEMQAKILEGYREYNGAGVHLTAIYRQTMRRKFGCVTVTDPTGIKVFSHPDGKPFPTYQQFAYRVDQHVSLTTRQTIKYGDARMRDQMLPSVGRFTDSVGYLMETIQADAYQVEEIPLGYQQGSYLPRLWGVTLRCVASGMLLGIGFSVGSERASAYRMAWACMALDKVWFCRLFGIEIRPEDWPCQGLPSHDVTDRGPGATKGGKAGWEALLPAIDELTPSYSGQSKATIETTHPKEVQQKGAPQHKVTRMTIPQLVVREIRRLIKLNHTLNVGDRLNNNAIACGVLPTPIHLWNYLEKLGRTHARRVPRDDVIRAFFTTVEVSYRDGALYRLGQRYWAGDLESYGAVKLERECASGTLKAYWLDVCVRHLFVDSAGGMLTGDAMLALRDGEEQLYISAVELEQLAALRARGEATWRKHRDAAASEQEGKFEEETGIAFDQASTRKGRAKSKSQVSMEEGRQLLSYLGSKGGAR
jgi:hypothetical protein